MEQKDIIEAIQILNEVVNTQCLSDNSYVSLNSSAKVIEDANAKIIELIKLINT